MEVKLVIRPRTAQVDVELSGERGAIEPRLHVFQLYTRHVPEHAGAEVFQVGSGQEKIVDLHGAIQIALAQPVGDHRPAQGAREQVGAAAQGGHQFGFEVGRVPGFGAQTQAMGAATPGS